MINHTSPSASLNSFNCPQCKAFSDHKWYYTHVIQHQSDVTPFEAKIEPLRDASEQIERTKSGEDRRLIDKLAIYERDFGIHGRDLDNLYICECLCCKEVAIWLGSKQIHPINAIGILPNPDLNTSIQEDFLEATQVLSISPRSATALLRLCVQKLCIQLGKSGKHINNDIGSLVKDGLDIKIQKALDIVRVTGNNAVHPGELNLKDDLATATKLFQLVNLIADTLITQPKNIDAMFDDLPEGAKKAITKRDK